MIAETDQRGPSLSTLVRKTLAAGIGALQNRSELLAVEFEEERTRFISTFIRTLAALFLGLTGVLLLTATIIFLFPNQYRIYAAGGFALLYLAGAAGIVLSLKSTMRQEPFAESLAQLRKDSELLDAFK